jgi:hypothetical protein
MHNRGSPVCYRFVTSGEKKIPVLTLVPTKNLRSTEMYDPDMAYEDAHEGWYPQPPEGEDDRDTFDDDDDFEDDFDDEKGEYCHYCDAWENDGCGCGEPNEGCCD